MQPSRNRVITTSAEERYDPGNTFHINQNIQPASDPGA